MSDRPQCTPEPAGHVPSLASQLWTLAGLLLLLGLSAGSALVKMGAFNTVINVAIAILKSLLVLTFFMKLRSDSVLLRIVAAIGFAFLAVMIGLSLADLLTRQPLAPPW